jgi:AraC-like DNA-binding protein
MHSRSSKIAVPPPFDPLTDMMQGLRLDGVEYGRREIAPPWAFSFPAQPDAVFHFVGQRGCWMLTPAGVWVELGAGDAVLLPSGSAHALASAPDALPQPFPPWRGKPINGDILDFHSGLTGEGCILFYGTMRFNLDSLHPLRRMMPDVIRVDALMTSEPAIPHMLESLGCEMAMNRVGACGIVCRLADILAAQILRSWIEHDCDQAAGWLAAVRTPEIGRVLAAIHASPERDWTVSDLAKVMGASRSGFASKFTAIVGDTPARYVAEVRMRLARQWLQRDRARIADVAQKLGYESEAAFSRAFKRIMGTPPSHFRARQD